MDEHTFCQSVADLCLPVVQKALSSSDKPYLTMRFDPSDDLVDNFISVTREASGWLTKKAAPSSRVIELSVGVSKKVVVDPLQFTGYFVSVDLKESSPRLLSSMRLDQNGPVKDPLPQEEFGPALALIKELCSRNLESVK